VDDAVLAVAAVLTPPSLRSLDAIHLATALRLGDDLGVFLAYDERLLRAAAAHGLPVAGPGQRG
jgi:predicted nucleic acid-binding protein